jgi:AraC-like DNA-binding protein
VKSELEVLILVELFYNFVISTLVGLFGVHLLTKKGLLASKFLGLFFLIFCIRIAMAYFVTGGRVIEYPHAFMLVSPIHFIAGPVGFLFVYFMLYPKRKFRVWQAVLFIPFVLHTLELLPFYFGPVEDKIKQINLMLKHKSLVDFPGTVTFFSPRVLSIIKVTLSTGYALASFVLVVSYILKNKVLVKANRFLVNWLLCYTALGVLSAVFVIAYVLEIIGFNDLKFSYSDLLMHLAAFVNIVVVLMRPALLDGVTFQSLVSRLQQQERQAAPDEDAEKLQKYEQYAAQLEKYFVTDKPFLTEDVSLDGMAKKMGIPARDLSRTVHYMYHLSYPDFVNSWRINYILAQRKEQELWKTFSQDVLAEQSGFGSRQGLHNAINRLHGMTPATFFAQKDIE